MVEILVVKGLEMKFYSILNYFLAAISFKSIFFWHTVCQGIGDIQEI